MMIMTLLALIALGLLSLSSVTLRSNTLLDAQTEARANARLALMLALGELQQQLGPDQRISAAAAILDDSVETSAHEDVAHPHWTGVWNSWAAGGQSFGSDEPSEHRTIAGAANRGLAPAYEEKRRDHFRSWLVSINKEQQRSIDSARSLPLKGERLPGKDSEGVLLMGRGTYGAAAQDSELVSGALLGIGSQPGSGANHAGRYAWWVADESTKARILPDGFDSGEELRKDELLARAMSAGSTGHDVLEAFEGLNDPGVLRRVHTRRSLELPSGELQRVRGTFHDVTPYSYGVLADVREGGLKRDLNALLERPIQLREQRDDFMLYRFGRNSDRVPLQDLAAYYQLYREQVDYQGQKARNPLGRDRLQINNPDFTPGSRFKREYTNLYRMPVPVKIQFLLSYIGKQRQRPPRTDPNQSRYKIHVGITPAVTLWNPYNVPLVLNHGPDRSTQIRFFNLPIALRWKKVGANGSYESQRPTSLSWITNRDRYGAGVFRAGGGDRHTGFELFVGGQKPIVFAPGEVRVFSLRQTSGPEEGALIEDTNQYRPIREVEAGWDPNKWLELPRSDRNGDRAHVEQERQEPGGRNDDGIGGALSFDADDQISFSISAAENPDLANGAALQFFFRQSSVVRQGEGGPGDNRWMRRQFQMISRMHEKGPGGRESEAAIDFHRELMRKGFPGERDEIEFPPIPGREIIGQTRPFLLVSLTAGCEVYHDTTGDAHGRRFASRPFLHSTPIVACPFVDREDHDSFYHHGWNWWVQDINSVLEAAVQVDPNNVNSYYGGGYSAEYGTTHLVQQEVPLTPLHSIASLSHARLGGYSLANDHLGPGAGETRVSYQFTTATGANGLFPHMVQAIGNSYAHPYLGAEEAVGSWTRHYSQANGPKNIPMVDHSYLANKALWDDYFFSSIAPHLVEIYEGDRKFSAEEVAHRAFFEDRKLPNRRLVPYRHGITENRLAELFGPGDAALGRAESMASHLLVEGPFNVNSTSVDAWRALFSSLRGKAVATLALEESLGQGVPIRAETAEGPPIAPVSMANGTAYEGSSADPIEVEQWIAWRSLTDEEIEELAQAMVKQVKRRGPFLSLSEFVNRRLDGGDRNLSVKGALQSALDDPDVRINEGFRNSIRTFSEEEIGRLDPAFPEALEGPVAYGSAAYVDQADILRNFGGQLTPRGDTFVVRAYGDSLGPAGEVRARAWCEAVVQRVPEYLQATGDRGDPASRKQSELVNETNRRFGRRFRVVQFRWLSAEEV
ncbi:MAG: hypothetical protein QF405_03070 [Roseibacillus sp.]|nr:hypothetical protein [Roseibacillus sp.]HJM65877.1 hypothetical protein [Roseibacillus sp.]